MQQNVKRKELKPELRPARERGHIAYLRYDKLVINPSTSTPKLLQTALLGTRYVEPQRYK